MHKWLKPEGLVDGKESMLLILIGVFGLLLVVGLAGVLPGVVHIYETGVAFVLFMCLIVVTLRRKSRKLKELDWLKCNGQRVMATILSVEEDFSWHLNHKHPTYIICEYDGESYESRRVTPLANSFLFELIQSNGIKEISMLINLEDKDCYYVELESLNDYVS